MPCDYCRYNCKGKDYLGGWGNRRRGRAGYLISGRFAVWHIEYLDSVGMVKKRFWWKVKYVYYFFPGIQPAVYGIVSEASDRRWQPGEGKYPFDLQCFVYVSFGYRKK